MSHLLTKNDILRRLRYALQITDTQVATIMQHTGQEANAAQVAHWLKREDETDYLELSDEQLCCFLDGLIIEKRGPRPDGTSPTPLKFLSNNEILKKLRIALELREEGMSAVFEEADFVVTLSLIHI